MHSDSWHHNDTQVVKHDETSLYSLYILDSDYAMFGTHSNDEHFSFGGDDGGLYNI